MGDVTNVVSRTVCEQRAHIRVPVEGVAPRRYVVRTYYTRVCNLGACRTLSGSFMYAHAACPLPERLHPDFIIQTRLVTVYAKTERISRQKDGTK